MSFLDICLELEERGLSQQVSELEPILSITREVMELTITEEDLEVVKTDDIPAIARRSKNSA